MLLFLCEASLHLTSVDPFLGKIDKSTMSQQTLMELCIEGLVHKYGITRNSMFEDPKSVSEWYGVEVNENEEVISIKWELRMKGSLDLQWLPETVTNINVLTYGYTKGTVDCARLPVELTFLEVSGNSLSGSLDLDALPNKTEYARFHSNKFSGEISLVKLPKKLMLLDVSSNLLSGSAILDRLPNSLQYLNLENNRFSGEVTLIKLAEGLLTLEIERNCFFGNLDLTNLPKGIQNVDLSNNNFEGETDFSKLPRSLKMLDVSSLRISGEIRTDNRNLRYGSNQRVSPAHGPVVREDNSDKVIVFRG